MFWEQAKNSFKSYDKGVQIHDSKTDFCIS